MPNFLGRNPSLWIAVLNGAVLFAATLGLRFLDGAQAGAVVVVVNAASAAINAWTVRPLAVPVYSYLLTSIVSLFAFYGLNVSPEQLATLNATMNSVLALLVYGNVSPVKTSISSPTEAAGKTEVQTVPEV